MTTEQDLALLEEHPLLIAGDPQRYIKAATSDNTRKAYQQDIRHFEAWGGQLPATSQSILSYLHTYAAELNPHTLARRLVALKHWHTYLGFSDPTTHPLIAKTLLGIRRMHAQPVTKAPVLTLPQLHQIVMQLQSDPSLAANRDNAILQLGFFAGLRRSEIVSIELNHLQFRPEGIDLLIPTSKTDPLHQGQVIGIPYGQEPLCPVTAVKAWLATSGIQAGPLFRQIKHPQHLQDHALNARSINLIIKKRAQAANLYNASQYSGHSLRRGMATSASLAGASESAIMRQGRWKSRTSVSEYIEMADRFEDNVVNTLLEAYNALDKK